MRIETIVVTRSETASPSPLFALHLNNVLETAKTVPYMLIPVIFIQYKVSSNVRIGCDKLIE